MGIYVRTSIEKENTSIGQQKELGIKFCRKNKYDYQVYEDIGKSGYKIEDENDPFKNRQGLLKLITDIENKIIDKVWVYEHSRLSRNEYSSFVLFRIFEKYNITVYENDKKFDFNNPQNKMIQGILTQISQYERHLITSRTTRGVHDTINRGIRGYSQFYGYKKGGIKDDGYMKWIPVESEIEKIRFCYQRFLSGNSIYSIIEDLYKNKLTEKQRPSLTIKFSRTLQHFEYTGYSLNTDGLEIFNKFKKCEIESIKELKDKKYYVKSVSFPVKIVSIENWIKVVEKLQVHKKVYKDKMRRTDTEIFTGIIQCPYCEMRYYYTNDKNHFYYKHFPKKLCKQLPKSFRIEKMNNLVEVFFFYFYLVYDDTKRLIEESQKIIKLNLSEIKEKIKTIETDNKKYDKQIENLQSIYEGSTDKEFLKLTLKKENDLNIKRNKNIDTINILKNELEDLNKNYDEDELELTYYNVKDTVINFIENVSVEEKRMSLLKIIKNCQVFNKYLVIDTGKLLFIFDTEMSYELSYETYVQFVNDKKFKDNFFNSSKIVDNEGDLKNEVLELIMLPKNKRKNVDGKFMKNIFNYFLVRQLDDISIREYYLDIKGIDDMRIIMKKKLQSIGIDYTLTDIEKIICFFNF